ncbi:zf-HC2 domain-containing protein [Amycolatopsis sp. K13G38]|uniref:Zf-HC2 domain-containing protein n=1 Tax=Amycolatopsis acididurans TaxID=2724524 RepID=A0ABX1JC88_9PSEU|nr:zf-HC2 domain-containing protein [Amycolatopsis acididurans]NKQ56861.1 zf-HC2 domain-containing protein [Amycolatopsis acididurans]
MSVDDHAYSLGAYVLAALDPQEIRAMEWHLASCGRCQAELVELRMSRAALDDLPLEALLEGPPEDGELLLRRVLRQVRHEAAARSRRRRLAVGVAAAAVAAAFAGGGVVLGRATALDAAAPAGTALSATDSATGASMSVVLGPAAGWVRLDATVSGIPAGEKCRLFVVGRDGTREEAGSWLVPAAGEGAGTHLGGAALVAPDNVAAIEVESFDGRKYVTVRV